MAPKVKFTKVALTEVIGSTKAHIPDRPAERDDGDSVGLVTVFQLECLAVGTLQERVRPP